jgi:hypothetical protein
VADEPSDDKAADAQTPPPGAGHGGHPNDPRYYQRNFAERLFPGPSKQMSRQVAQRIEGLLQPLDEETRAKLRQDRQNWRATNSGDSTRAQVGRGAATAPATPPVNVATTEDIAQVREALDEQNELLRAILASSVDTQEDARATAQNSRTFAWAGTAIALLTLVATVLSIVAATGH